MASWHKVRGRGGFQPRAILLVALVWVLLWDRLSLGNAINGLIVGVLFTQLFPLPSIQYFGRIRPLGVISFAGHFLLDLIASSWQVVKIVLSPGPMPPSSIVEVPLRVRSEFYMTLVATIVGLVPGSTVIEARRSANVLFVHVLGAAEEDALEHARANVLDVERRLLRALGSDEEIAACTPEVKA